MRIYASPSSIQEARVPEAPMQPESFPPPLATDAGDPSVPSGPPEVEKPGGLRMPGAPTLPIFQGP